ncbi:MAG: hypothetical protein EZS28_016499 [Streblomastix strix]|uniref:Uncharacterized protein n=1 Tax=Streblomastix strix TaxID=222440 RepID=A0A5J4W0G5_9EUKA|nr:MAG: hypothetical protein EZS28_016499 [Streblomastix strix]
MAEVLRSVSVHPQSFCLSILEFFDQPKDQMMSDGQRNTRATLGAKGKTTCQMAQSCQVNRQITIPPGRLALQLNYASGVAIDNQAIARQRIKFNGLVDPQADWTHSMQCGM